MIGRPPGQRELPEGARESAPRGTPAALLAGRTGGQPGRAATATGRGRMKEVPEKKPTHDHRTGPDGPAPRTEAPGPSGGLAPHQVQRLQGAVGNAAVARLVAQRYTAPVKTPPNAAPGFRRVGADVAAKKRTMAAHPPAAAESKSAQDAAVAPPDDKEAQGKAANAEKMNAAKPGEFDKAAFVAAVDKAIEAQAPKNLDEADKFSKSGKADKVKDEVDGKVTDGKNTSAKDIETTTKAPPDTSAAKDKPVTPMTPDNAPGNPGAPSAADAIPEKQPPAVTDFSQGPAENDKAMADAEVTEEQLAKGNEPEFDDALKAKKTAETDSAKAPGKAHTAEDQQLATAKAGAAAAGAQAMNTLTATRAAAGKAVDGGKGETKSKDERKRAEVTAKLQKVFDATKKDVETTLTGLDQKVDTAFTTGEKSARDAFTADHKARMKKYKDKRYGGFLGKGRWLKDKFAGMPQEANDLYQESRKLYVARMRTVISSVADMIGVELGHAKTRIAQGRTDLKAEVDKLPADLKSFGEEAQQDFAGKFEDLEASVDEKSQQLVQDLANKYTAALNAVDEEIKKLQEANKGLIDKAKDAIVGVIKTINELKNLLLGILAKAASAIMKIIKDPIGFLGNLVKAVGAGLNLFVANIGDHLKKGLVSWLLGTATKAGLEIPERFDLRGIITLITSLLGLTWDNIRTRITRKGVPEEAMTAVETSVPVAQSLAKEGPAGAVKEIEAEAGDLKSTILSKLTEYLVPTVIIAGVTWILSLLNPASAFVRAVKGIIDIVTFVVNQGAQIADFVNAVLDAVIEIANGGAAGVPKMIETALAASIPLLIGFLASLLGIGNLANKVKSVFQAVSKPVNRAIDKIVDFIAKKGKALWQKRKGKPGERKPGKGDGVHGPKGKEPRSQESMAAVAQAAAREAYAALGEGREESAAPGVLASVFQKYQSRGLKSLKFIKGGQDGSLRIQAKVNPTSKSGLIGGIFFNAKNKIIPALIHEARSWAVLKGESAGRVMGGEKLESDEKTEFSPPTYSRGFIRWNVSDKAHDYYSKIFQSSSLSKRDQHLIKSSPEAHGEEKVVDAMRALINASFGPTSSLEGVRFEMEIFINRSSCVSCATHIAAFVAELAQRGAVVDGNAQVGTFYSGGALLPGDVWEKHADLIDKYIKKSYLLDLSDTAATLADLTEGVKVRRWGQSGKQTTKEIEKARQEYQKALAISPSGNVPVPDNLHWRGVTGEDAGKLGVAVLAAAGVATHAATVESLRRMNFSPEEIAEMDGSKEEEHRRLAENKTHYKKRDDVGGVGKVEQQMNLLDQRFPDPVLVKQLQSIDELQELMKKKQKDSSGEVDSLAGEGAGT
ncbi:phage tail protein [Streptomyces hydrogenans]|uniref:phage tail protein n=1 Tax=Streptomyces hydrogenans TaxID=1873719 RepID=UPI0038089EDB